MPPLHRRAAATKRGRQVQLVLRRTTPRHQACAAGARPGWVLPVTLVAELQKDLTWRHIPVIVITASDLSAEDRARLNSGIETILMKGNFNSASLTDLVRQVVAERRKSQKMPEAVS